MGNVIGEGCQPYLSQYLYFQVNYSVIESTCKKVANFNLSIDTEVTLFPINYFETLQVQRIMTLVVTLLNNPMFSAETNWSL